MTMPMSTTTKTSRTTTKSNHPLVRHPAITSVRTLALPKSPASEPTTLAGVRDWLRRAPAGTMVPAAAVLELLDAVGPAKLETPALEYRMTWRERIWLVPDDTRLGVHECAEVFGEKRNWVWARTRTDAGKSALRQLPVQRIDGNLVFRAADLRAWMLGGDSEATTSAAGTYEARRRVAMSLEEHRARRQP